MTQTNQILKLTHPVTTHLAKNSSIVGVLCFGSAAIGLSDDRSDIDLFVICDPALPEPPTRQSIWGSLKGISRLEVGHITPGWESPWSPQTDTFCLENIIFDIVYNTRSWTERVVSQVVHTGCLSLPEMPFRPYTFLGLLDNSLVLTDPQGIIARLKERLYPYPPLLKQNILQQQFPLITESLADLKDYADQSVGNTAFLFHLVRACDALISILWAVNERYDPATKRSEAILKTLKLLPHNFCERYETLLTGPFDTAGRKRAVGELDQLVKEIQQ